MARDLFAENGINYQPYQPRDLLQESGIPAPISKDKISRGEAALTTATNVPFAPRIKAGLEAGYAKAFGGKATKDESLKSLYNEGLENELDKLSQAREQYPVQSFATQLPADIAVGGEALKSIGLGKSLESTLGGAAALGGTQAIGETKDLTNIPQTGRDAAVAAAISTLTSGVLSGAGNAYHKLFNSSPVNAVKNMTADDVKNLSSDAYKLATAKGGTLKPEFINSLNNKATQLDKQTDIGKALSGDSPISKIKPILEQFQDKKLDLNSLQELDEALGDKIDNYVENGVIKKEGLSLLKLQNHLRDMVSNATPDMIEGGKEGFDALNEGRALWSKAAKLRDVEKIITRAEMMDNPATGIKTGFRTLYNNPDKMKYFNNDEKQLIKNAAQSGIITDTLRTFGSRLIPIGEVIGGGGFPSVATGQVASMASRNLATRSQIAKANKVSQQILSNISPKTKTVINPLNPVIAAHLANQQQEVE